MRSCQQLLVNEWINEASGIRSFIKLERERHIEGKPISTDTHYYISSLGIDPKEVRQAIRTHWEMENKVHWVLMSPTKNMTVEYVKMTVLKISGSSGDYVSTWLGYPLKRPVCEANSKWLGDEFRAELIFG